MMQYKGYIGKVELDADAGLLHGEVIGIRDVITFQGRSVAQVQRAFRESVDVGLWRYRKSRGRRLTKPCPGELVIPESTPICTATPACSPPPRARA